MPPKRLPPQVQGSSSSDSSCQFWELWKSLRNLEFFDAVFLSVLKSAIQHAIPASNSQWSLRPDIDVEVAELVFNSLDALVQENSVPGFEDLLKLSRSSHGISLLFVDRSAVPVPELPSGSRRDYDIVAQAFEVPFVSCGDLSSLFHERVASSALGWTKDLEYYSPFLAVVQSSMSGKSRMSMELSRRGVFVIPFCLRRDADPSLRPPRTPHVADWGTPPPETLSASTDLYPFTNQGCVFFWRTLQLLNEWLAGRPTKPAKAMPKAMPKALSSSEEEQSRGDADEYMVELATEWAQYLATEAESFWKKVHDSMIAMRSVYPSGVSVATAAGKGPSSIVARAIAAAWMPRTQELKEAIAQQLERLRPSVVSTEPKAGTDKAASVQGKRHAAGASSRVTRNLQVLFFIDEARQFTKLASSPALQQQSSSGGASRASSNSNLADDLFVWFRRSMQCLPYNGDSGTALKAPHMFCVVTDTTSSIANLAPALVDNPTVSLRLLPEKMELFAPFFLMKTQDLWWKEAVRVLTEWPRGRPETAEELFKYLAKKLLAVEIGGVKPPRSSGSSATSLSEMSDAELEPKTMYGSFLVLDVMTEFSFMVLQGRPFHFASFGCDVASREGDQAMTAARRKLVRLLKAKLLNDATFDQKKKKKKEGSPSSMEYACSDLQALAVLSTLAAVEIGPSSQKASDLSAKHMRMLSGVSMDREQVYTIEPVDSCVVMGARELMMEGYVKWHVALDAVAQELRTTTMRGFRGELAGQVLTLMAWEKLLRSRLPQSAGESEAVDLGGFPAYPVMDLLSEMLGTREAELKLTVGHFVGHFPDSTGQFMLLFASEVLARGFSEQEMWPILKSACTFNKAILIDAAVALPHCSPETRTNLEIQFRAAFGELGWLAVEVLAQVKDLVSLEHFSAALVDGLEKWMVPNRRINFFVNVVVKAFTSLHTLEEMREKLQGAYVRVNQFTKTFRKVSKRMLVEGWLRGAAVYCVENQPVIDLVVPMYYPSKGVLSEGSVSGFSLQLKRAEDYESENYKLKWMDNLQDLSIYADAREVGPFVSLFCEFGPVDALDSHRLCTENLDVREISRRNFVKQEKKRKMDDSLSPGTREHPTAEQTLCGFAVFATGLSVSDVYPDDRQAQNSFKRLLRSVLDPSAAQDIWSEDRAHIQDMFQNLAFITPAGLPNSQT